MELATVICAHQSQKNGFSETDIQAAILSFIGAVSDAFGGCSVYEGRGAWKDENGEILLEDHTRIEIAFATNTAGDYMDARVTLERLVTHLADDAGQTCVCLHLPKEGFRFIYHSEHEAALV